MNTTSQIRNTSPPVIVMQRVIAVIALGIAFVVMGSIFIPRGSVAEPGTNRNVPEAGERNSLKNNSRTPAGIPADNANELNADVDNQPPTDAWGDVTLSSADAPGSLPLLGSLQSDNYRTLIFGTDSGPRYTVYAKHQKEPIAVLLDLQTLAMYFRDVPMPDVADSTKILMMVDSDNTAPQ